MRLSSSDLRVRATPGIPTTVTVEVFNDAEVIEGFRFELVGLEVVLPNGEVLTPRVEYFPDQLSLFPETSGVVAALVTLPAGYPSGASAAELVVRPVARGREWRSIVVELDVDRAPSATVTPVPRSAVGGRRTIFGLVLDNTGNVPLELALTLGDAENVLVGPPGTALRGDVVPVAAPGPDGLPLVEVPALPPPPFLVRLAPRERADVRLPVSAKRPIIGTPVTRIVTFAADPGPDVGLARIEAVATFTQRPLVPRGVLTVLTLVLALGLWGALLLAGVDRTTDEVAADNAALASQQDQAGAAAAAATAAATAGTLAGTVSDTTGAPVGDATVEVAGDGSASATSLTDGTVGGFEVSGLPVPGAFTITVTKEGYAPRTVPFELTEDAPVVDGLDLVISRSAGSITGTVTDTGGTPLDGVAVTAVAEDGGAPLSTSTADAGSVGFYSLGGLPVPGSYTITFARPGFTDATRTVPVQAAGVPVVVDVAMTPIPSAVLTGTVREGRLVRPACTPTTCALAGASVTVSSTDGSVLGEVRSSGAGAMPGSFVLTALPAGPHTVTIAMDGYAPQVVQVVLAAGANQLDVVLAGLPGSITGVAPGCVRVEVRLRDLSELNPPRVVQPAGADGVFGVAELPTPGEYRLVFFGPGSDGFRDVQVVDLTLGPGEARQAVTASCASSPPPG